MDNKRIQTFVSIRPMVYCYSTPGVTYHDGWVKIGYTERQTPRDRIAQQTHTPDVHPKLEWQALAQFNDDIGGWFRDTDFHHYLTVERNVERDPKNEWFHIEGKTARGYFNDFADHEYAGKGNEHFDYELRAEQKTAVDKTKKYFKNEGEGAEFLWNAKPRFGKTLAAYDLIRQMGFKKVLVVTNRPSIANSWAEDFNKFIRWRNKLCFVSELDSIKDVAGVMDRKGYLDLPASGQGLGFVEFESLQNLKGSMYFGGRHDKLEWLCREYKDAQGKTVPGLTFDLLIVDESHEGVDTIRTDRAFQNINRKYTLYLSGTPFKALADGQFDTNQIFNWTYADEQEAKANWDKDKFNPYEPLPRLAMFTYQLSNMIYDRIRQGADLSEDETVDYAFDLNEFFTTNERGKFVHEEDIKKFLRALTTQEKYPFSTPELRGELSHTLWLLDRVASAKALAKLLKEDPVFSEYEIVLAAGDGRLDGNEASETAFNRVKGAIAENNKTITLSVGQLTVGVTIPEWCGVLMLCNMQSPASYMQAAFRAQNKCMLTRIGTDGKPETVRKETAYVFDFDPARTLIIFDEFANNLSPDTVGGRGTAEERRAKITKLLNFFPVLGEDNEGKMVELDAAQVLSIPRRIKSVEVVRRGFMSNFLFQNIGNVFGAPTVVKEIIGKLTPAHEEFKGRNKQDELEGIEDVRVDQNGNVDVPQEIIIGKAKGVFGPKIYKELTDQLKPGLEQVVTEAKAGANDIEQSVKDFAEEMKKVVEDYVIAPAVENYGLSKSAKKRVERQVSQDIECQLGTLVDDFLQEKRITTTDLEKRLKEAGSEKEFNAISKTGDAELKTLTSALMRNLQKKVKETIREKPVEVMQTLERLKAEEEKKAVEDSVRDHLRGFSRTVPSFIMAYGDKNLTLANFDEYTEDDVFQEVTGISEEDFRFLRDGGDYKDPVTGKTEHFSGQLFDETVFNDSVQEFLKKKAELADYFNESHTEDIFDYIPPQRTNQIFTPRWVVKKMVDLLEGENPGCFDDPTKTFADLYMKSGLYIAEIVKRLYNSKGLKKTFPDKKKRIQHILRKQVFGMAPSRIIYLIATNYILGFDKTLRKETKNFVEADSAEAAKNGTLEKLVKKRFG